MGTREKAIKSAKKTLASQGGRPEAIAYKRRLERLGHTVFTPYYQPRILFQNGKHITLKWGTWNIITP
jgi:hypothetical protein